MPYPHATADHQALNARYFEAGEGRLWFVRKSWILVPALVEELLGTPERLQAMGQAMRELAKPDAAAEIADELVRLAERG